jgi:hypothetical protein
MTPPARSTRKVGRHRSRTFASCRSRVAEAVKQLRLVIRSSQAECDPRRGDLQLASPAIRADRRAEPSVTGFYEATTGSIQYVVADPVTRRSAVIDPVLDFDPRSGSTRTTSADRLLRHIEARNLTLEWILDTHPHADHFSFLRTVTRFRVRTSGR